MKTRVISGLVALCIFIPCLIFSDTAVFDALIATMAAVAVFETVRCQGMHKKVYIIIPTMAAALIMPLTVRIIDTGMEFIALWGIVSFILVFYMLSAAVVSKGKLHITDAALCSAATMYVIFGFSSILLLRATQNGAYVYLLVFISAWITDTGAYFTGVKLGRHKLIPDVSPKKTVEGAVGGIVTCVVSFVIYALVVQQISSVKPDYLLIIISSVVMSVISMFGDLIASLIKRNYNIKDYGKIMPGHGGVMDRFDSIIATASFLYLLFLIPGWEGRFI